MSPCAVAAVLVMRAAAGAAISPDPEPKPTNSRSAFFRGCSQRERGLAEVLGIACFLSTVKLSLFCGFALGTWLRILDSVTFVCAKGTISYMNHYTQPYVPSRAHFSDGRITPSEQI
ncbi:granule-bound starch synthase1b [Zea mays]|uniref:Granule-bound starch synthase1b n=1 Tax=Zea mays TaxID=4577 RepID=A0A1D6HXP7_MAIZE|nr:granule-bound starch synthase1b [Zea mays]